MMPRPDPDAVRRVTLAAAAALALLAAGCNVDRLLRGGGGSGGTQSHPESRLTLLSGDNQSDTIGATLSTPYAVRVVDELGEGVGGITVRWDATRGGGSVNPASSVTDASGTATATRALGTTVGAQLATASATGLDGSPITFTATAAHGAPAQLVFIQQPTDAGAGQVISPPVRVAIRDRLGNTATGYTGAVTVSLTPGTGTPGATLSGTLSRTPSNGVAVFDNLRIDLAGVGYRLRAATAGRAEDSAPFDVLLTGGSASSLSMSAGDDQTGTAGSTLGTPYGVRATDASGGGVGGVAVSWAVTAGGGSISPGTSATDGSGYATASRILGTSAGTQTATASVSGLSGSPVTFTATAVPGPPAELVFTQQPSDAGAGQVISPAVRVTIRDQYGNVATNYTGAVTVSLAPGTGTPGATLSGTLSRTPSNGVAVFVDLRIDLPGVGYRLRAATAGRSEDSAPFNVLL